MSSNIFQSGRNLNQNQNKLSDKAKEEKFELYVININMKNIKNYKMEKNF